MFGCTQAAILGGSVKAPPRVYAVLDSANKNTGLTLSNNDLTVSTDSAVHRIVYLNMGKTSGLWSFEVNLDTTLTLSPLRLTMIGIANSRPVTDGTFSGGFSQSVAWQTVNGDRFTNGVGAGAGTYNTVANQNSKALVVMDCNNKKILCVKGSALLASGAITGTTFYGSVSLYDAATGVHSATINTGQTAFSAANESLIAAYETANSVTINRGVWL